ncbi:TadE/TadG family type IV pilus assembly protein [Tianweitania populi]|uniref:Pilus assembly protein TadE n=1 Tax=Tianweitania populi TaxID=1607949 RepID=A0A8J3GK38_9HYPH|nr:pilus assembly protein TadE [Tianweitania populi]
MFLRHRIQSIAVPSLASRFLRDQRGSTAIEFVALALPFSLLVFAILESCLSFAGQQVLTNATDDIARKLRTGQIKSLTETELKNDICDRINILVPGNCSANLSVDLRTFTTFAEAAKLRVKIGANGDIDTSGFKVEVGKSGTKNMLRTFYRWPVITDIMRSSMSNLRGNKTLHFATATWQNEPFDD